MSITLAEAKKRLPLCAVGTLDGKITVNECMWAAVHELDMFNEGQDGCCTAKEAAELRRYIEWLTSNGIKHPDSYA